MKTCLLVVLSLLFLSACSPASPTNQSQTLPDREVMALLTSLTPSDSSQVSQVPPLESASLPQLLQEVIDVTTKRRTGLATQVGWLHIWTRNTQSEANPLSPTLSPRSQFEQDQWLELDRNGLVQRAVRKTMDESGKTLFVSVLKDGAWVNLTYGAQSQAGTSTRFDPNYGFDELADRLVRQGSEMSKSLLYRDCWYQGEKYTITNGDLRHEAVFDTGHQVLRSIKTWQVAENGDVSLVDSMEVLLEERAPQPPDDVQAILDQGPVVE